jgi:hypothetical protein
MSKKLDASDDLSHFEMFKISYNRTGMAKSLIKNRKLIGLSKSEVINILGKGHTGFIIGGDYNNSLQYVIDAEKRSFQFYGESGIRNKYFMVFFDTNDKVKDVHITNSQGKIK